MSPEEKKNTRLGCAVIALLVLLVGGCVNLMDGEGGGDGGDGSKSSASSSVADASDASDPSADASDGSDESDASDASDSDADTITVPDYTGRNLQEAQDDAQGRGVYLLKSDDLSVR
ncbi:hypothetical protein [Streptomyces nigrescens]|uniref:hypothetical protein n=1 Tax=Streptomyces nigrescens TaxID=1920 RepID=UPI0022540F86|nr:hypothetical protein [Streptomyces libani]MCX5450540.1 hypothetical protein [Streptomyces libani]